MSAGERTLIGSVLTLIGFVALVISLIPILQTMSWEPWVERISIFKAYNPIQAVNGGETYQLHLAILIRTRRRLYRAGLRGIRCSRPAGERIGATWKRRQAPGHAARLPLGHQHGETRVAIPCRSEHYSLLGLGRLGCVFVGLPVNVFEVHLVEKVADVLVVGLNCLTFDLGFAHHPVARRSSTG